MHSQVAHGILFETIRQLEDQGIHVPQSLRRSFVLLHSYILVGVSLNSCILARKMNGPNVPELKMFSRRVFMKMFMSCYPGPRSSITRTKGKGSPERRKLLSEH